MTTHCPQGINCLGDQGPHGNCHLAIRPSLLALSLPPSNPGSPCIKKPPLRSLPCTIQCPALPLSPSSASHPTDLCPFLLHSSHQAVSAPPASTGLRPCSPAGPWLGPTWRPSRRAGAARLSRPVQAAPPPRSDLRPEPEVAPARSGRGFACSRRCSRRLRGEAGSPGEGR